MHQESGLKARQIKAARALLEWSQENLAKASSLSIATIRKLEAGNISPRGKTQSLLRNAFENAGLEFLEPDGVRHRPDEIFVYQGDAGIKEFFDDVYEVSLRTGKDIVQVWTSANSFNELIGDYREFHSQRMLAVKNNISVKAIVTEPWTSLPSAYCEGRFLSRQFVDSVPFYVYGDKYAIIPIASGDNKKVIVIQSRAAADAFRAQFKSMWERATPIHTPAEKSPKSKK